jgi:Tol biopolymer transport system component
MLAGSTVDHYEIGERLGAGGMGEVYRAVDTRLQRTVALKLLSTDIATPAARQRFQREAQTASSLNHPHIVAVHDVGAHEGREFLVMELVDGWTLCEWIAHEDPSWRQTVELLIGVADGLARALAAGVLHRDIKPGNVLVDQSGYAKLSDFGLAKLLLSSEQPTAVTPAAMEPTRPGVVMGTIAYMSPEQAEGTTLDARSDIFSFGVVLYEALARRLPFEGATGLELLQNIRHASPKPIAVDVPPPLRFVIEKALEKEPADRYQSMEELVVDLRRTLRSSTQQSTTAPAATSAGPTPTRRRAWVIPIVVLIGVAIGAIGDRSWFRPPPPPVEIQQLRVSEFGGLEERPAVSPDGSMVAFVASMYGRKQIWGYLVEEGELFEITPPDDVDRMYPRWIGQNTLIYYEAPSEDGGTGSLWRTAAQSTTAPPVFIAEADGEADVSHESRMIATFRTDDRGPALRLIDQLGEGDTRSFPLTPGVTYSSPRWSPDDESIAFEAREDFTNTAIQVIDPAQPDATPTTVVNTVRSRGLAWLPDGEGLVYASSEGSTLIYPPAFSLWTIRLDGTEMTRLPLVDVGYASYVEPDITPSGALVASRIRMESDIYAYPIDGSPTENVANAIRVTNQTGQVQVPSVSHDGELVAFLRDSGGHANVWVAPTDPDANVPPRQITFERDPSTSIGIPRCSPTHDRIVYLRRPDDAPIEQKLVDSTGRKLNGDTPIATGVVGMNWSADGEWLYMVPLASIAADEPLQQRIHVESGVVEDLRQPALGLKVDAERDRAFFGLSVFRFGVIFTISPVENGTPEVLSEYPESRVPLWPHEHELSPDGSWLAAPLLDRDTTNLYLISTDDGSFKQVTDFGDRATLIARQIDWGPQGTHIYAALVEMDADIVLLDGLLP